MAHTLLRLAVAMTIFVVALAQNTCHLTSTGGQCDTAAKCCTGCCQKGVCSDAGICFMPCNPSNANFNLAVCNMTIAIRGGVDAMGYVSTEMLAQVVSLLQEGIKILQTSANDPMGLMGNIAKITKIMKSLSDLASAFPNDIQMAEYWGRSALESVVPLFNSLQN